MPKIGLSQETKLQTRNNFTKIDAEVSLVVNGTELPNMGILGEALELAIELIQKRITESYQVVPARADTPMAEPYVNKEVVTP